MTPVKATNELLRVRADDPLWARSGLDWTRCGVPANELVEIHLGVNAAFTPQGDGNVPCWCVARNSEGRIPGTANSPGFALNLDFDALVESGCDPDQIYLWAWDCNLGEFLDPTHGNAPVCSECVLAGDTAARFEGLDEEAWQFEGDERPLDPRDQRWYGDYYPKAPEPVTTPCWSCSQMAEEC